MPQFDPKKSSADLGSLLAAVPLDSQQIVDEDVSGSTVLKLQVQLIRGGALTVVTMAVEETEDAGVTWSALTEIAVGGVVTPLILARTTSVTENFSVTINVKEHNRVRIRFNGTNATVDDTITVLGRRTHGD